MQSSLGLLRTLPDSRLHTICIAKSHTFHYTNHIDHSKHFTKYFTKFNAYAHNFIDSHGHTNADCQRNTICKPAVKKNTRVLL